MSLRRRLEGGKKKRCVSYYLPFLLEIARDEKITQKVERETTALTCDGSGHAFHQAIRLAVAGKVIQVILVTVAAIPSGRSQEPDVVRAEDRRGRHTDKHLTSG